jgi:hypothetical protein
MGEVVVMTERWAIFIVGACLTMGTAAVGQIVTMVWFAAKVKVTVDFLRESIERHEEENEKDFAHQSTAHREAIEGVHARIGRTEKRVDALADKVAEHDRDIAVCAGQKGIRL